MCIRDRIVGPGSYSRIYEHFSSNLKMPSEEYVTQFSQLQSGLLEHKRQLNSDIQLWNEQRHDMEPILSSYHNSCIQALEVLGARGLWEYMKQGYKVRILSWISSLEQII
eukprot:TRINITY_DN9011_c0_g1_i4.p2 TRINITY_DN9011_c0_g1~~TRINITY_DN9011_c0_g1_i4.p2  ORF type:complete len:129 (+),score=12.29 TRINITY_DN9011_c0_g1_i4:60-389(+)